MFRVAWWSSVLVVLGAFTPPPARARILERCELARELRRLDVRPEHIPVWVCIAYHESRFDTAALNPGSGDHGLLQISELYWCGAGKACGLPCTALRDEDIADDVECALRVYEEHTRLQGDGFLAWVVYPQHCKQNTKKYLADCSVSLKDANTTKSLDKSRSINTVHYEMNTTFDLNPTIDELKPPYFSTMSNIGHRGNELETTDRGKVEQVKWQHIHFPNIDDLSLPVFNERMEKISTSPPTTTTTTVKPREQTKRPEINKIIYTPTTAKPIPTTTIGINFKYNWETSKTTPRASSRGSYTQSLRTTTTAPTTLKLTSTTSKRTPTTAVTSYSTTTTTARTSTTQTSFYQNNYFRNPKSFNFSKVVSAPTPLNKELMKKQFRCLGCRAPATINTTTLPQTTSFSRKPSRTIPTDSSKSTTTSATPTKITTTTVKNSTSTSWRTQTTKTLSSVTNANKAATAETNSIFDLYLNTKRPKLSTFKFAPRGESWYKRRIFFDGTTSPATPWKQSRYINNGT